MKTRKSGLGRVTTDQVEAAERPIGARENGVQFAAESDRRVRRQRRWQGNAR